MPVLDERTATFTNYADSHLSWQTAFWCLTSGSNEHHVSAYWTDTRFSSRLQFLHKSIADSLPQQSSQHSLLLLVRGDLQTFFLGRLSTLGISSLRQWTQSRPCWTRKHAQRHLYQTGALYSELSATSDQAVFVHKYSDYSHVVHYLSDFFHSRRNTEWICEPFRSSLRALGGCPCQAFRGLCRHSDGCGCRSCSLPGVPHSHC